MCAAKRDSPISRQSHITVPHSWDSSCEHALMLTLPTCRLLCCCNNLKYYRLDPSWSWGCIKTNVHPKSRQWREHSLMRSWCRRAFVRWNVWMWKWFALVKCFCSDPKAPIDVISLFGGLPKLKHFNPKFTGCIISEITFVFRRKKALRGF